MPISWKINIFWCFNLLRFKGIDIVQTTMSISTLYLLHCQIIWKKKTKKSSKVRKLSFHITETFLAKLNYKVQEVNYSRKISTNLNKQGLNESVINSASLFEKYFGKCSDNAEHAKIIFFYSIICNFNLPKITMCNQVDWDHHKD